MEIEKIFLSSKNESNNLEYETTSEYNSTEEKNKEKMKTKIKSSIEKKNNLVAQNPRPQIRINQRTLLLLKR